MQGLPPPPKKRGRPLGSKDKPRAPGAPPRGRPPLAQKNSESLSNQGVDTDIPGQFTYSIYWYLILIKVI